MLPRDQRAALDRLEASALMRQVLGDAAVDAVLAVRRHEMAAFDGPPETVAEQLRLAWTV